MTVRLSLLALLSIALRAQTVCGPTPQYSPCDLVFDIPAAQSADVRAEFRSPRLTTTLVRAFHDSGTKWIVRYTPAEAGTYTYRLTGNVSEFSGKQGQFTATANARPGWMHAANLHHFAFVEGNNKVPHLWMGAMVAGFAAMDQAKWNALVDTRAAQHFNHLAVILAEEGAKDIATPAFFHPIEEKIRYANQHGIIVDVAFFGGGNLMNRLLPSRTDREQWFTTALLRLAPFDVSWQGLDAWETYPNGRTLLKEIAGYIASFDPYKHTRTSRTASTSAPTLADGWPNVRSYQTSDDALEAIEQQLNQFPALNNFGTGAADTNAFVSRLWTATVNGQYPATTLPNEQAANAMKVWYDFMQTTRHWELEPFFDTDPGRGLSLEGVEYVVYLDKPGAVAVHVEKHGYDVEWLNPFTGDHLKVKDACKNEACNATPPDSAHPWVLHISRESEKASMLRSVKFDSREEQPALQQVEGDPEKLPFEIVEPSGDSFSAANPPKFQIKMKRQSRALERSVFLITGDVTASGAGYRVLAAGPSSGTLQIPASVAADYPAALHVQIFGMNGLGKVYQIDRNYTLTK